MQNVVRPQTARKADSCEAGSRYYDVAGISYAAEESRSNGEKGAWCWWDKPIISVEVCGRYSNWTSYNNWLAAWVKLKPEFVSSDFTFISFYLVLFCLVFVAVEFSFILLYLSFSSSLLIVPIVRLVYFLLCTFEEKWIIIESMLAAYFIAWCYEANSVSQVLAYLYNILTSLNGISMYIWINMLPVHDRVMDAKFLMPPDEYFTGSLQPWYGSLFISCSTLVPCTVHRVAQKE